ncbi:MAG: alpha-2-macroglobulin family protein [Treponema sp.]|nr:alpha-2-macroglobulin family protein [Treponema sp.]
MPEKKTGKNWLRFFLGSYTPPEFLGVLFRFFFKGGIVRFLARLLAPAGRFCKAHRFLSVLFCTLIVLLIGALAALSFYQSRRPQPIVVDYWTAQIPHNAALGLEARPLMVEFYGSVAPLELLGKDFNSGTGDGSISINPPVEGVWRWEWDDTLMFTASGTPAGSWEIGRRYTVNFGKGFLASHVVPAGRSFSFEIPDFSLSLSDGEFYIDPEDAAVKRVTAVVRSNYPMDSASLESALSIEPRLSAASGRMENRPYVFSLSYNQDRTVAYIVSEPLGTPARETDMIISLKRGVVSAAGQGSPGAAFTVAVTVPGMTDYVQVRAVSQELVKNDDQRYDQVLIISTRGTIEEAELSKNLQVWELPLDRPELPGLTAREKHRWNIQEMLPEVLALGRPIELDPVPGQNRYNADNGYRFSASPDRYVYIKLDNRAKFYGDYYLNEPYETIIQVRSYPKELAILSEGSVLSFSGDKRLALFSRGIEEVNYTIGRIRPDDINHLVSQTLGDIAEVYFRDSSFTQNNVSQIYRLSERIPLSNERDIAYFSFDFSRYLEHIPEQNLRHGLFIFSIQGGGSSDQRLIMVSDLGFFVKTNADSSRDLFVQSIATGEPVADAQVQVLGLNGNPIISAFTGADGHARFPDLSGYRNDQAPTVFTVRLGEDLSFMPYRTTGRTLDYSSFDVGGLQGADNPNSLRAFLFSDRGLYRPGDQVYIGMAVKSGDWVPRLEGTPLECTVSDPRGQEIYNRRISLSSEGVEEISFRTQDWSPTGTYTANVYVIRPRDNGTEERVFLGSQTVKVEEFLPDTLQVNAAFDPLPREGWIAPGELKALVTVRNLFGSPAAGNEVKAQMNLSPGHQYFRQYRDYQFRDPYLARNSYQEFLGTVTTNDEGEAAFTLNTAKFEQATYSLAFYVEAFEKGSGRNVSTEAQVYVSPLPYLIGYKADGNLNYIQRDTVRKLSFIAINPQAERSAVEDLTLSLVESRYVSVLVRQSNGLYKYQSVRKDYPLWTRKIAIPAAGLDYELPTTSPGEFHLVLSAGDEAGIEYNRIDFSVAGTTNLQRSLNRTAELEITLNKADFNPGEEIEIMVKAPYRGSGLITIERDKVYAYKWISSGGAGSGDGETILTSITAPPELEGNGYVNIQFVRDQSSPEIFMSPLSYGAVPFSMSRESRTNRISLDIRSEAKSGEAFTIRYSASKPGKAVIYAVDEGILQLADYRTPDPLGFFFRKRALEVRTTQILDLILPPYAVAQSLAVTGGGAGYDELARNLNPFKRRQDEPVAYWSGIVDLGPEERELSYTVPDHFNGTLRVMAVAVSPDSVGVTEDQALIRNTFVIVPNGPLNAAPGDEFDLSLTLTNLQRGVGEEGRVRLSLEPSAHLSISGPSEFDLAIPEGKDHTLSIPVKAAGPLGSAEIRFTASNGDDRSSLSSSMSIRPATPYRVNLQSGAISNRSVELTVDRQMYEEFHTRELSLSYLPIGMARGLSFYLNNYPYGCTEQILSAAFPFLYPRLIKDFGYTRAQAEEGIDRVIGILQARMKEDGSIGMWTSRSISDPMITAYACQFLTEARNAGYYVPQSLLNRLLSSLRDIASAGTSSYDLSNRAYAIYVLTLNEIVTTSLLESLKRDIDRYNKEAETELPGLYLAGTYALLQKSADAASLLGRIKRNLRRDPSFRYIDSLLYQGLYLSILSRHFPQRLRDLSESLFLSMAEQLENQNYTTISANFALMGLDLYLKAVPSTASTDGSAGAFTLLEILRDNQRRELSTEGNPLATSAYSAEAQKLRLENKDPLNLFYQITSAGFDRELPSAEIKNGIEVYREFLDADGETLESVKAGDALTVRLTFRTLNNQTIDNVALVDLFPAGLEPDIDSIRNADGKADGNADASRTWTPDYADIREDRLVLYGTISSQANTFSYRARAINTGLFTVPPLFAEAMYDKTVWALCPQEALRIRGE